MIPLSARPRLADKAKLRLDRKTDQYVLLYPEKGLLLNRTGSAIVLLCTGEHTVQTIVERLCEQHEPTARPTVEAEVLSFLDTLAERGLLRIEP